MILTNVRRFRRRGKVAIAALAMLATPAIAWALTFTQFDIPGAIATGANGINDRGQVVGAFVDGGIQFHGFFLDKGVFTQIDVPGAGASAARGISDRGRIIVLWGPSPDAIENVSVLSDGAFSAIDIAGVASAHALNDRGQIVGSFVDAGGAPHGYVLEDGVVTVLDFPGGTDTNANGINGRGQIVGHFTDAQGVTHGFLLDDGAFTQLDVPDSPQTLSLGISDRGQIVGITGTAIGQERGFLWDKGRFTLIDVPGAIRTDPVDINDRGQIAGYFFDVEGNQHGFVASPGAFSGKATGVGAGEEEAGTEIVGRFAAPTDLDLSAATVTILSLLDEERGGGELVRGLPLVLTAVPGSGPDLARFEDRTRPNFTSVAIKDVGSGEFTFRIEVNIATIAARQGCSPTRLTTRFRLDDAQAPPLVVSAEQTWICFGPSNQYLRTP